MTVFFTEHYPDANTVIASTDREKPPLKSIISKMAILRKRIENVPFPSRSAFPWKVSDVRIAQRIKKLLGIDASEPYLVQNKTVNEWLNELKEVLGNNQVSDIYLTGSAAVYGVNLPFMLNASQQFKPFHNAAIERRLTKRKYQFGDVDIKIKVKEDVDLFLFRLIMEKKEGCVVNFSDQHVVNLTVSDSQKQKIDFVIYKELSSDFAFFSDDFCININRCELDKNISIVNSLNPWNWLKGQLIGLIENEGRIDHHLFPRLLGKLLKGEVCTDALEDNLFKCWSAHLSQLHAKGKRNSLKFLLDKQWNDHESGNVLSRYLLSLRVQQKFLKYNSESSYLYEAARVDLKEDIPAFIKFVFKAMKGPRANISSIHGAIECIALIALFEGWEAPFQVKLISHQGEWVLRIRFPGNKDLLVRFDVNASLRDLNQGYHENIREIVRSLSIDGISRRERTDDYIKQLKEYGLDEHVVMKLRKCILRGSVNDNGKASFAEASSLAELEMIYCEEEDRLLDIGVFVFEHYAPGLRRKICWEIVNRCLLKSADLVNLLRNAGETPREGYAALFEKVLDLGGDIEIYKACSPFPYIDDDRWGLLAKEKTSKRTALASLLDHAKCSGELFLQFIQLNHVAKQSLSEEMLYKLILFRPQAIEKWIKLQDRSEYRSDEYKKALTDLICEMPHFFEENWILDFIESNRFVGNEHQREELCKYFVYSYKSVLNKAKFLELLKIDNVSLWHTVANECISQGEILPPIFKTLNDADLKVVVACYEIIVLRESSAQILEKLERIKHRMTDTLRGSVLIRLLKKWNSGPEDLPLLEFLDISKNKIDWRQLKSDAKNSKDLLKYLRKVSLGFYTSLFRAISPSEEYYHAWWVEKVSKSFEGKEVEFLVKYLEKPHVKGCLRIIKKKSWVLIEKVAESKEGINLTLDLCETVSQDHFLKMLRFALTFDDDGKIAVKLCARYLLKFKKNKENSLLLEELCQKLLIHPRSDFKVLCLICKFLGEIPFPKEGAISANLIKLMHAGLDEYVYELHKKCPSLIPEEVVNALLSASANIEKRAMVLLECKTISEIGKRHLETTLFDSRLSLDIAGRLLIKCVDFDMSHAQITKIAIQILPRYANAQGSLEKETRNYLIQQLDKLDLSRALSLWEALRKSNTVKKDLLWKEAFSLFERNPDQIMGECFCDWIVSHCKPESHEKLLKYVDSVVSNHKLWEYEDVSKAYEPLLKWVKKMGAAENSENSILARSISRRINLELKEIQGLNIKSFLLDFLDNSILFQAFKGAINILSEIRHSPKKLVQYAVMAVPIFHMIDRYVGNRTFENFQNLCAVEMGYAYHKLLIRIAKLFSVNTNNERIHKVSQIGFTALAGITSGVGPLGLLYYANGNGRLISPMLLGGTIGAACAGDELANGFMEMENYEKPPQYVRTAAKLTGIALAMFFKMELAVYSHIFGNMSPALAFLTSFFIISFVTLQSG